MNWDVLGKYTIVFAGLNNISMFLAHTSQTCSIDNILERVGPYNVMSSA